MKPIQESGKPVIINISKPPKRYATVLWPSMKPIFFDSTDMSDAVYEDGTPVKGSPDGNQRS
jgi:hypothetical protein